MRKIILGLGLFFIINTTATAEVYRSIDIDDVYNSGEWNSRDEIKQLIDDYTLLIQYQNELNNCPIELPEVLGCYDKIAEKIVTTLYVQAEYNVENYKQLKKALSDAYGLKNCRNKYAWPSGHMCNIDRASELADKLKEYIQDLINHSKEKMFEYSPILEKYK